MTSAEPKSESVGAVVLRWWSHELNADTGSARGLRARLRRADGAVEVLSEPAVHLLFAEIASYRPGLGARLRSDPSGFVMLVRVLAHLEAHEEQPLARRFGQGEKPVLSAARLERVLRLDAGSDELTRALIRAVTMLPRPSSCNIAALANDLIFWGERTKIDWWFAYFGSSAPARAAGASDIQAETNA